MDEVEKLRTRYEEVEEIFERVSQFYTEIQPFLVRNPNETFQEYNDRRKAISIAAEGVTGAKNHF